MEAPRALSTPESQPFLAELFAARCEIPIPLSAELDTDPRVVYVGRLRVPIAGPYRPWARLYRLPDDRRVWVVRLWECDRVVRRLLPTSALLEYARLNRLADLARRVRSLDRRGRSDA